MSLRRKAREFALQMMFQWEMSRQEPAALAASFWRHARADRRVREFATRLFTAAVESLEAIDALLASCTEHWRTERMAAVDRNILRVAVAELRSAETPPGVVLDQAVELAGKFSTEESGAFINGVLAAAARKLAAAGGEKTEKGK